jgi:RNA polymerase-binding protein DksA
LDPAQLAGFKGLLRRRLANRREEVLQALERTDHERYRELAGEVRDTGDQSLADLLVDVNLAEVDRNVAEIRAVEAALERIAGGTYGECVDCGGEIELARLQVTPTSQRCTDCQARYERTHAQPGRHTL